MYKKIQRDRMHQLVETGHPLYTIACCFRDKELCERAVELDAGALEHVPVALKTPKMCELVVRRNGMTLAHVPAHLHTPELDWLAVNQNGNAISHVPVDRRTPRLCELAVERDGTALNFVPRTLRTQAICELAFNQTVEALDYIPMHLHTSTMYVTAIEQHGLRGLELIPHDNRTEDMCQKALQSYEGSLDTSPNWSIPVEFRDQLMAAEQLRRQLRAQTAALVGTDEDNPTWHWFGPILIANLAELETA